MSRSLVVSVCLAGILSGFYLVLGGFGVASSASGLPEERVGANLVRVRINGKWEEFPLVPLADHLCAGGSQLFERYCDDDVSAPGSD